MSQRLLVFFLLIKIKSVLLVIRPRTKTAEELMEQKTQDHRQNNKQSEDKRNIDPRPSSCHQVKRIDWTNQTRHTESGTEGGPLNTEYTCESAKYGGTAHDGQNHDRIANEIRHLNFRRS